MTSDLDNSQVEVATVKTYDLEEIKVINVKISDLDNSHSISLT